MEGDQEIVDTLNIRGFHFNPLPPHGGRLRRGDVFFADFGTFQSTPSAWRETYDLVFRRPELLFQSTPSAWRETGYAVNGITSNHISIHSLRMEGDGIIAVSREVQF